MGLYHHLQAVFPGVPLSFAVLDSYAEQVFTGREVVESDAVIYSDGLPRIGKSFQNILHLIFLQLLIGQRDDTQGEGILIVCQFYLFRIGNVPAQRAAGSVVVYIGIIHDQIRRNEPWRGVMPLEGTGRELHYAIVRPEVDVAFSVDSGRRDIELVVEHRHLSREQLRLPCAGIVPQDTAQGRHPEESVPVLYEVEHHRLGRSIAFQRHFPYLPGAGGVGKEPVSQCHDPHIAVSVFVQSYGFAQRIAPDVAAGEMNPAAGRARSKINAIVLRSHP